MFGKNKHKRKEAVRSEKEKEDKKKSTKLNAAEKKGLSGIEGIEEENIFNIEFDDLDFEEPIGKGSFGKVWKGDYHGTPVAIKRFKEGPSTGLDTERLQKYIWREITVLRNLRHPNFVQFMGLCTHDTGQFLITEYVEGGDLRHYLTENPGISWKQRVAILRDVAIAMTFLHRKSIIHRDLKLENLLITDNGRIKICDLGLARVAEKERYMTIAGSDEYMAPEVMNGDKYDEKCDIFSFGIIMGVLVGERRLPSRNRAGGFAFRMDQLRNLTAKSCPKPLADLFISCCETDPHDRPSFKTVLDILKELLDSLTAPAPTAHVEAESSSTLVPVSNDSTKNDTTVDTTLSSNDSGTTVTNGNGTTVRKDGDTTIGSVVSADTTIKKDDATTIKTDSGTKERIGRLKKEEVVFNEESESYRKAQLLKRRIAELRAQIASAETQSDFNASQKLAAQKRETKKQCQEELGRATLRKVKPSQSAQQPQPTQKSAQAQPTPAPKSQPASAQQQPIRPPQLQVSEEEDEDAAFDGTASVAKILQKEKNRLGRYSRVAP